MYRCLLAIACLLLLAHLAPADEFDSVHGLSPPIYGSRLYLDARVEDPPVYNGVSSVPLPAAGDTLQVQIFLPKVAGMHAYGYTVSFDNTGNAFTDNFRIVSASAWTGGALLDRASRQTHYVLLHYDMSAGRPTNLVRAILFVNRPTVPGNGVVASVALQALKDVSPRVRLIFDVSVAVYSTTPPSRIWNFRERQTLYWR